MPVVNSTCRTVVACAACAAAGVLIAACTQRSSPVPIAGPRAVAPEVTGPAGPSTTSAVRIATSLAPATTLPSTGVAQRPVPAEPAPAPATPAPATQFSTSRKVSIIEFGGKADGATLNTAAIQRTIDALAATGGTVVIPEGTFLCGALFLKPHVNVHLEKGAVLKGSTDVKDFPMTNTRIEGHFQEWVPAMINASACDGLVIDGEGTLDGSGQPYWDAFRAAVLADRSTKNLDVPRPRLVFIRESVNVRIADVRLLNSGFWNLHLYKCQHVTIDALDIRAGAGSPSTDGIDIDSSQFVNVSNTFISNNDDCIALKGTKGVNALEDKDSPPVEHIHVKNCVFAMGNGLITCGSEATVVRDVVVDHCRIAGPDTRGIAMLRLKLRSDTPQDFEDIHFSDITLDGGGTVLAIAPWTQYENLQGQPRPAHTVKNLSFTNIQGAFGTFASIRANAGDTLSDFAFENITLKLSTPPNAGAFDAVSGVTHKKVTLNGVEW